MNGAQALLAALVERGVERIYGYPGGTIMPVYDALVDSPIEHVLTRHEQGAIFAADGHARSTGEIGVCLVTSGPGATNLLTGIANAHMDSVPILIISGQVMTSLMGTDAFQETDFIGMSLPVVKHSILVRDPNDLAASVREACAIALDGRPGPVVLDLPKNVGLAEVTDARPAVSLEPAIGPAIESALEAARKSLRAASQPVIYAGGGIGLGDAVDAFRAFVKETGIPVVSTLKGLGAVPTDDDNHLGMLGMHGFVGANHAVQEADLLVAVGVRFDDRATGKLDTFAPEAAVIHLDGDPAELGKLRRPTVSVCGDLGSALEAISMPLDIDPWREKCFARRDETAPRYDAPMASIFAPRLIRDMSQRLERDAIVACDVGQHQMWFAQHGRIDHPRCHLTSGGLGAMGYGLPAGLGAKVANPETTVVVVSGDGSFMMNVQELATLRRLGVGLKIVLIDNESLGMVRQWQELFCEERFSEVDLSDNPDFVKVAEAFGISASRITRADEVDSGLTALFENDEPYLLHVCIDSTENVWPIVPAGRGNHEMRTA